MDAEKYSEKFEEKRQKPIRRKKTVLYAGLTAAVILLAVYALPKIMFNIHHESTDNAFVKGDVVPIAPMVKGKVAKVYIEDNMKVKKGDKLFELDTAEYEIALDQRKEELSAAMAQIARIDAAISQAEQSVNQSRSLLEKASTEDDFAKKEMNRYGRLADENLVSRNFYDSVKAKADESRAQKRASASSVDIALATLTTLRADRKTAEFKANASLQAVRAAELDLERTSVYAPSDGLIGQNNVKEGRYIMPGQTVISMVSYDKLWVEANFKETQLEDIRIGQSVRIKADAFPSVKIAGHVDSIQPGTGSSFSLLPAENATGNFVKVVQRVPVKIILDSIDSADISLIPGLSVIASVKTN
ncbi:MAG: HlyD family secretion protein [Deferribacterales bacterium]